MDPKTRYSTTDLTGHNEMPGLGTDNFESSLPSICNRAAAEATRFGGTVPLLDEISPNTQHGSVSSTFDSSVKYSPSLIRNLDRIPTVYPTPAASTICRSHLAVDSEPSLTASLLDAPLQKLSCRERKRIIVPMDRPPNVTKAMKAWIAKKYWLLDPFREDDECWFHPSPPPPRAAAKGTLRPFGNIQRCFTWQDHRGKHAVVLNFGIFSKLLLNMLKKQQIDGFICRQWHLSHLCGNWTCLNPAHTMVEPGSINISRNKCFSHRSGCGHIPQCIKDLKVALGADGRPVDLIAPVVSRASQALEGGVDEDSCRYDVGDEDEAMTTNNTEESESFSAIIGDSAIDLQD